MAFVARLAGGHGWTEESPTFTNADFVRTQRAPGEGPCVVPDVLMRMPTAARRATRDLPRHYLRRNSSHPSVVLSAAAGG
jgi:hypothetical protein